MSDCTKCPQGGGLRAQGGAEISNKVLPACDNRLLAFPYIIITPVSNDLGDFFKESADFLKISLVRVPEPFARPGYP